jgi:type II secretory pathway component GspD/PulD (secretin)
LIQFQDVPITTAIENLARQAGINYLIDPKIGYGQPDQNGQIKAEPTLSIRWENVTAGQALMALLDNYGLQLSEDRKTQIARITAKDPMALLPLSTHVVQLKWASTSNMVDSVQAVLTDKRSRVIPDTRTSQLVVVATEKEQDAVDELINTLDKPTRQVLIETKLVQISSNPSTKKGIDWSGTLEAQNISFGNGVTDPSRSLSQILFPGTPLTTTTPGSTTPGYSETTTTPPFAGHPGTTTTTTYPGTTGPGTSKTTTPNSSSSTLLATVPQSAGKSGGLSLNTVSGFAPGVGFLSADGAHAVLSFLNASADAQVVSTPRVVTLDNQTAIISVTRGFPIFTVIQSVAGVSSGSSSITYSNIGTTLQVTPRISANDFIWLKVIPDVSSWFDTHSQTIGGQIYTADIFDTRHIETQVLIPNAHTLVMGGLVTDNPNAHYTKVPVLGDIPGLGWAFRSENKTLDKGNLLIFITPTIVQETDFRPISTDFLKSRPNTMKSPMNPNSIWDGAQPRGDWSNPAPVPGEFDKK